jgi:hypothetical protein
MRTFILPALILPAAILTAVLSPAVALADPHPLPYSYPTATLPAGSSEIEQYVDMTPVRTNDLSGADVTAPRAVLVTEVEYGITDRLELGMYLQFSNNPGVSTSGDAPLHFDGLKQRLRYRFVDPGVWPVNVAVYGEVAELSNELELEAKLILDRRFGRWLAIANLWGEREFYYSGRREWVANPTGGISFEVTPAFYVGVEYWMHGEFGATQSNAAGIPAVTQSFNAAVHHYVGPAFMLQAKQAWVAIAPYVRVDDWSRDGERGDLYGRFWIRTILGINL